MRTTTAVAGPSAAGAVVAAGLGQPKLAPAPPEKRPAVGAAPIPKKPDATAQVKEVLTAFYRNLAAGKAKDNEALFRSADAAVSV